MTDKESQALDELKGLLSDDRPLEDFYKAAIGGLLDGDEARSLLAEEKEMGHFDHGGMFLLDEDFYWTPNY